MSLSILDILLEGTVDVEYHTVDIDTMPHVMWMIRSGDSYVAKGTSHTHEKAKAAVAEKLKVLGCEVGKEIDKRKDKV